MTFMFFGTFQNASTGLCNLDHGRARQRPSLAKMSHELSETRPCWRYRPEREWLGGVGDGGVEAEHRDGGQKGPKGRGCGRKVRDAGGR